MMTSDWEFWQRSRLVRLRGARRRAPTRNGARIARLARRCLEGGLVLAVVLVVLVPQAMSQGRSGDEDRAVGEALKQVPGRVLSVRSHRGETGVRYEVRILSNASHVRTVTVPAREAGLQSDVVSGGQAVEVPPAPR